MSHEYIDIECVDECNLPPMQSYFRPLWKGSLCSLSETLAESSAPNYLQTTLDFFADKTMPTRVGMADKYLGQFATQFRVDANLPQPVWIIWLPEPWAQERSEYFDAVFPELMVLRSNTPWYDSGGLHFSGRKLPLNVRCSCYDSSCFSNENEQGGRSALLLFIGAEQACLSRIYFDAETVEGFSYTYSSGINSRPARDYSSEEFEVVLADHAAGKWPPLDEYSADSYTFSLKDSDSGPSTSE